MAWITAQSSRQIVCFWLTLHMVRFFFSFFILALLSFFFAGGWVPFKMYIYLVEWGGGSNINSQVSLRVFILIHFICRYIKSGGGGREPFPTRQIMATDVNAQRCPLSAEVGGSLGCCKGIHEDGCLLSFSPHISQTSVSQLKDQLTLAKGSFTEPFFFQTDGICIPHPRCLVLSGTLVHLPKAEMGCGVHLSQPWGEAYGGERSPETSWCSGVHLWAV